MAATVLNSLYEHVRKTGLPYQINESGGSIVIKISSNRKYQFNQSQEKFRFHTSRTFNGSSNKNWRSPENFSDNSFHKKPSFPDITFFKSTPPPQQPPPTSPPKGPTPPPTSSAGSPDSTSAHTRVSETSPALRSSKQIDQKCLQLTSTPFNPYRSMKRQVIFPLTPNLFTPSPTQALGFKSASLDSSIADKNISSSLIGDSTAVPVPVVSKTTTFTTEDMEAIKNLMKHLHEKTKF